MRLAFNDEILKSKCKRRKFAALLFRTVTGFYRDGYCRTGPGDHGVHTACRGQSRFPGIFSLSGYDCLLQCLNISFWPRPGG